MIMHFIIYENSHFEIHIHPQKLKMSGVPIFMSKKKPQK